MDRNHVKTTCKYLSDRWAQIERRRHKSNLRNIKDRPSCTSFDMMGIKTRSIYNSNSDQQPLHNGSSEYQNEQTTESAFILRMSDNQEPQWMKKMPIAAKTYKRAPKTFSNEGFVQSLDSERKDDVALEPNDLILYESKLNNGKIISSDSQNFSRTQPNTNSNQNRNLKWNHALS